VGGCEGREWCTLFFSELKTRHHSACTYDPTHIYTFIHTYIHIYIYIYIYIYVNVCIHNDVHHYINHYIFTCEGGGCIH